MPQTNDELKTLANDNDVDITGATTKAELVAAFDEAGKGDLVDADTRDDAGAGEPNVEQTEGETAEATGPTFTDPTPSAEDRAELVDGGEAIATPTAAGSVGTDVTPAHDDETPAVLGDARVDDGVVRTNSAVEPIADVLTAGAGRPVPPPANVDRDGREVFPDGVAPTARADYQGPGAPAGQGDETDE